MSDTIISLLGTAIPLPNPTTATLERLTDAEQQFRSNPSLAHTIWYGRRLAYANQLEDAIRIYSEGIKRFPHAYQLYRHRGHRFISQRNFVAAIDDFSAAAKLAETQPVEIEPDGLPNALNMPLSNGHFNIWYHLGLAHYLSGAFEQAAQAYQQCLEYCYNDDCLTATIDWYYMALRRQGMFEPATKLLERLPEQITLVENDGYYQRLLMYQGKLEPHALIDPDQAEDELTLVTQGYGLGNWYLTAGDTHQAMQIYRRLLTTQSVTAFGYIAAEADVCRLNGIE
jgi:tetratricopeptide (TPR) repeat protein